MSKTRMRKIWEFVAVLATGFSKDQMETYKHITGTEFDRTVAFHGRSAIAITVFVGTISVALFGTQWWLRMGGDQSNGAPVSASPPSPASPSRGAQVEATREAPRPPSTPAQAKPQTAPQPVAEGSPSPKRSSNVAPAPAQDAVQGPEVSALLRRNMISVADGISVKEGMSADLNVAEPPSVRRIKGGVASYDSVYTGSPPGYPYAGFNPFEGGLWSNSGPGSAWALYAFNRAEQTSHIYIRLGGTDVTSRGSVIEVAVRMVPDGDWIPIFNMRDKVINRDFSGGKSGPRTGPIMITLGKQMMICGVKVSMWGHGWFGLGDVQILTSEG